MSVPSNSSAVSSSNPIEGLAAPVESEKCLQWITYSMTKDALNNELAKQKHEVEMANISFKFNKQLTSVASAVKPNDKETLVLSEDLKSKLADLKAYPEKVRADLEGKDIPENRKQELIASAQALADRVSKTVEDIEKNNLSPEARKNIKEDLDLITKEIGEDNGRRLNTIERLVRTLHEMYSMARSIVRTVHEVIKNFLRKIDPR